MLVSSTAVQLTSLLVLTFASHPNLKVLVNLKTKTASGQFLFFASRLLRELSHFALARLAVGVVKTYGFHTFPPALNEKTKRISSKNPGSGVWWSVAVVIHI